MKSKFLIILFLINLSFLNVQAEDFWNRLNLPSDTVLTIVQNKNGYIFAGTKRKGVFRSSDNGESWIKINNGLGDIYVWNLEVNSKGHLFACAWKVGMFRSTDNGENWVEINNGLNTNQLYSIFINKKDDIFVGTWDKFLYKSTNNGNNWTEITPSELNNLIICSFAENDKNYLYLGTELNSNGTIFRSTDEGITWKILSKIPTGTVMSIQINSLGYIFACSLMQGIFRSKENDINFEKLIIGTEEDYMVQTIIINKNEHIFASYYGTGIYRSTDNGENWIRLDPEIDSLNMRSLSISKDGYLFGPTWGKGLYRSKYPLEKFYISAEILPEIVDTLDWNDSLNFSVSVKDKIYETILKDANISIINSILKKIENVKSDSLGKAYYSIKIPDSTKDATYPFKFFVTKFAYEDSDTITRLIEVRHIINDVKEIVDINSISFFPNPITEILTIRYFLNEPKHIKISIIDIFGIEKAILIDEFQPTGSHNTELSTDNLSSGVYFFHLDTGGDIITKKMQIIR